MKATLVWPAALLLAAMAASLAPAQTYCSPVFCQPLPQGPDACGPGFFSSYPSGLIYGPNYNVRPPNAPFQPVPQFSGGQGPRFPAHLFARSPRDFFMAD